MFRWADDENDDEEDVYLTIDLTFWATALGLLALLVLLFLAGLGLGYLLSF